ncbi:DUF6397 family protein [Streptomyces sp. NPDC049555]|uniref:DUF6397 family protein n=1 Tax=Streptomyces sp. NPDC049555 TaxID=3154930 RepID=UPI0034467D24
MAVQQEQAGREVQRREARQGRVRAEVPFARAARELGLGSREFELAVQLGEVRTAGPGPGDGLRVSRAEIERHRSATGFPEALRSRLWTVGTAEGAELLAIGAARFTRLARAGCFTPVKFYVNRYRVVVWHYLASELVDFAEASPDLLSGRIPAPLRQALEEQPDRRPRGWRARRVAQLTAAAAGPWQRAAAVAAVLETADVASAAADARERACLEALRPVLARARPGARAAGEVTARLVLAADPDERDHYRHRLAAALAEARAGGPPPAPPQAGDATDRGADGHAQRAAPAPPDGPGAEEPAGAPARRRGLWSWLRGRA